MDDVLSLKKCLGTEDIPGRLKCGLESYSGNRLLLLFVFLPIILLVDHVFPKLGSWRENRDG